MQEPAEEAEASVLTEDVGAEASISTENVEDSPNLICAVKVRRKAAKRTSPFELAAGELNLMPLSSSLPQAEDIPPKKKPRLEEPFSATADEATTKHSSHDTALSLLAAAASAAADADPVKRTLTSASWTLEEDAKLKSAVTSNCTKKKGKEYRIDWAAVIALVPDRTKRQCNNRWHHVLDPTIESNERTARWTADEDSKLKDAVQTHGGKNWRAIAALVPGRVESQCRSRWHQVLVASIDGATGRKGRWTEDEDIILKDAVQKHGLKNWGVIAALVPGRTKKQCYNRWDHVLDPGKWAEDDDNKLRDAVQTHGGKNWDAISALVSDRTQEQCRRRWHDVLDCSIDQASGRKGEWSEDEDIKLKDAVQTHGGKNWGAIVALVPGRTKKMCRRRWHDVLDPSIDRLNGRTGKWAEDEDIKLKDGVQTHGGKNWGAIALLVPGRTQIQCRQRWHDVLDPIVDRANVNGRTGKWAEDEDSKLKDAVQIHGGKNWASVAALVPGRTDTQCSGRWNHTLNPKASRANGRTGKWTEDEDSKLKDVVQTHGGKNWGVIAALVPGRTNGQCRQRWHDVLDPSTDRVNGRTGKWTEDEDIKLKDAVQYGGKTWSAIALLIPGRTESQCSGRWNHTLMPKVNRATARTDKSIPEEEDTSS